MSSQPVSGDQFTRISGTAAGTTVVSPDGATLKSVVWGGNFTGTLTFYNVGSAAGTTAANHVIALNNNTGTIPDGIYPNFQMRNGITVVVGGTTDMTVGWDK